jgi:hypothetical protein
VVVEGLAVVVVGLAEVAAVSAVLRVVLVV